MSDNRLNIIYGGSFNPPHKGHQALVKHILNSVPVRKLLLLPAFYPPHKPAETLVSYRHRFAMTRILFSEILGDKVQLSALEYFMGGKSYTWKTIEQLSELCPGHRWAIALGSDSVNNLHTWKNPEYIVKHCDILELSRVSNKNVLPNDNLLKKTNIINLKNHLIHISSTEIRNQLKTQPSALNISQLTEPVAEYIDRFNLYQ